MIRVASCAYPARASQNRKETRVVYHKMSVFFSRGKAGLGGSSPESPEWLRGGSLLCGWEYLEHNSEAVKERAVLKCCEFQAVLVYKFNSDVQKNS